MEPQASGERRDVWSEALSKAQAVKVRNVMNPLLWLNAVSLPLLISAAYLFQEQTLLSVPLIFGAIGLPIWTMWEYRYFARKDPKRLHSEEYLLEHQRLLIQSKSSKQLIDASSMPMGPNPELGRGGDIDLLPSPAENPKVARLGSVDE